MMSQVLLLLIILSAIRTLLPLLLVGVGLTIFLMLLEILELFYFLATMLTGLILVFGMMSLLMFCEPRFDKENLVAGGALIGWCRGIMLSHVKIQGGLVTKVCVTCCTVEGCLFHVLSPEVSLQPAYITQL